MATATINGVEVYYELRGNGPRLLLFNGSGASLETSGSLLTVFTEHFELLAHDQRGLGRTATPPGPYTMADYAADAAALLDHVGWEQCRVVGISFGGMVAQEFAVTWPERVERLALLCTSAGGAGGASYPLHELGQLPADERDDVSARLLDTRFTPQWLAEHPVDAAIAAGSRRAAAATTPEQRRGIGEQLGARRFHDVYDRLGRITSPTLVAAGQYDGIAPVANSEAIAGQIPAAELRVYDGGHIFFVQDPKAFPDVTDFLRGDA